MSGRHSTSSHHVTTTSSPYNNNTTTHNHHHHHNNNPHSSSSRLTRGSLNAASSSSLNQQDMRVPTSFPIDPNLGNPSNTTQVNTSSNLHTPTRQQPHLPSFQHHYDTRPQQSTSTTTTTTTTNPGTDPRTTAAQYNSYPQDYHQQHQTPQTDYSGYDTSFGTEDQGTPTTNQLLQQHQHQQPTSSTAPATDPESQEIRRLAFAALTESVENLANRTRAEENGTNGEKARQMFGMSWLMRNCEVSNGATPRNRVYARYVSLCATERLKPLNPASFGKLVRAVYPDIKTRRLGVRGQSKYHYCGIKLRDDDPNAPTPDVSGDLDDNIKYPSLVKKADVSPNLNSRPSSVVPAG